MTHNAHFAVFRKIIVTTAFRGMSAVATFLMTIAITRNFSTQTAGIVLLSVATITVLGQLLTFGCHNTSIKITGTHFHNNNWNAINTDLSAFFHIILLVGTGLFTLFLLLPVPAILSELSTSPVIIAGILVAFIQLIAGAFIGIQHQNKATLFLNGLTPITVTGVIVIGITLGFYPSSHELTWIYTLSVFSTFLIAAFSWLSRPDSQYSLTVDISSQSFRHAKAMYPVVIAQLSTQYASQFALIYYLTESDFAFFSSALRTSLLVSFILMAANLVVAGKFAEHYAKGEMEKVNRLALQSSRILVGIALPLLLLLIFFADIIMQLFGSEYIEGSSALIIMALGQTINVATGATNYLLSMCGQEKELRKILLITFAIAIASALILTPIYGVIGAACANAIAVASQNLLATHYVKKHLGFNGLNLFRSIPNASTTNT